MNFNGTMKLATNGNQMEGILGIVETGLRKKKKKDLPHHDKLLCGLLKQLCVIPKGIQ